MTKKQKYNTEDNRGVAIYARKSRITNKGDSIGVQFKQCAEYAKRELHLDEDYTFLEYEDKGLSGYYSDRPDFQRMLHDIEMGKIRAVVCYKLDRIGRKTSDLLRLLDFLEKHKVDLLICSNNINTASGVSKIFIQIFAVVAEKYNMFYLFGQILIRRIERKSVAFGKRFKLHFYHLTVFHIPAARLYRALIERQIFVYDEHIEVYAVIKSET